MIYMINYNLVLNFYFFSKPVSVVVGWSTGDVQRVHEEDKSGGRRRKGDGDPIEKRNNSLHRHRRHCKHVFHHSLPTIPLRHPILHRSHDPISFHFLAPALRTRRKTDRSYQLAGDWLPSVQENPKRRHRPRLFGSCQWSGVAFQFEAIVVDFVARKSIFGCQDCLFRCLQSDSCSHSKSCPIW